jgi:plasmid stabilization system protein ParE
MAPRKKRLIVEWTETAERQFLGILEYWTERTKSTSYAGRLADAVWERTVYISKHPSSSVKTSFPNTRMAAMGHFSLIYQVFESKIIITAFWDNRQDPKKLYEMLKKESKD